MIDPAAMAPEAPSEAENTCLGAADAQALWSKSLTSAMYRLLHENAASRADVRSLIGGTNGRKGD